MMNGTDLELRSWIDRQQIEALIYRYSDAVTRGDWDQLEAVFASNATVVVADPFGFRAEGAQEIRRVMSEGSSRLDFLIHQVASIVINLQSADTAQATSSAHEMVRGMSPRMTGNDSDILLNVEQYGVYYDDIVRTEGEWKFAYRFCQPLYFVGENANNGVTVANRTMLTRSATFPPRSEGAPP